MKIIGVDPGMAELGWGVIDDMKYVAHGVIKTDNKHPPANGNDGRQQQARLSKIAEEFGKVIVEHEPAVVAIEDTSFMGSKYANSSDLNRVIGVLMLVSYRHNVPAHLYAPTLWKKLTLNYANADKRRVQDEVQKMLHLEKPIRPQHCSDATAVAIAHLRAPE